MKNVLTLLTVAGITAVFAAPVHADEFVSRYTYLVNGSQLAAPASVITQPAVIGNTCGSRVITQPAILDNACGTKVITEPAILDNACGTKVITQPAVLDSTCGTKLITQPAVLDNACGSAVLTQPAVLSKPIMIEDHERRVPHFFHIGLWPLVDFSVF